MFVDKPNTRCYTRAMKKPIVIAEIGCNHKGDMATAKELVRVAKECGANVAKFQKRHPKELLTEAEYNAPHPNPANAYGPTYGAHREFLELSAAQHAELKSHCEALNITYSTSVWDITSAREIVSLKPAYIKIASASNLDTGLLAYLVDQYGGEIHISLGMTSHEEEEYIVRFFEEKGRNKDVVLYSCTSGYPVPYKDVALLEILRLQKKFGGRVKSIGFSGHHLGTVVDVAAMTLGATHIERHFTLDRTWKGTDHSASLEPSELKRLCEDVENVALALEYKKEEILPIEIIQRKKLKATHTVLQ